MAKQKVVAHHMPGGGMTVSGEKNAPAPKKKAHRISIMRGANGGHTVSVGFDNSGMGPYTPDKDYPYGPEDHEKVMDHVAKFIGHNRKKAAAPRKGKPFGSAAEEAGETAENDHDADDEE